ncbi:hypothetical protein [Alkaliphilus transvaalensis]|uniref:hypothetical protein n=1 Tax=Alkaliphilus transvaalensis TaxID=114628 RepID=UPI0004790EA6|nr:hypothetical protein [Alkaliphilus transvaalensis]
MTRWRKEIIHWIFVVLLIMVTLVISPFFNGKNSSEEAFRVAEAALYFGPSEIIEEIDYGTIKIYLARYKNWVTAHGTRRELLQWYPEDTFSPLEIDENKAFSYSFGKTESLRKDQEIKRVFGYIRDPSIVKLQLVLMYEDEIQHLAAEVKEGLFIFHWDQKLSPYIPLKLLAFDYKGTLIYEEEIDQSR